MSIYYVYVLKSEIDNTLYVGYSENLKKRIKSHNQGKNKSTKLKKPWKLIFFEGYCSTKDAKRREQYFKTTKGKTSLRTMLIETLK